jgi:hypothetical protein
MVPEANAESLVNERLRAVPDPQNQEERDWNYHVDQIRRYADLNKVSLGEAEDAYDKSYGGHFKNCKDQRRLLLRSLRRRSKSPTSHPPSARKASMRQRLSLKAMRSSQKPQKSGPKL